MPVESHAGGFEAAEPVEDALGERGAGNLTATEDYQQPHPPNRCRRGARIQHGPESRGQLVSRYDSIGKDRTPDRPGSTTKAQRSTRQRAVDPALPEVVLPLPHDAGRECLDPRPSSDGQTACRSHRPSRRAPSAGRPRVALTPRAAPPRRSARTGRRRPSPVPAGARPSPPGSWLPPAAPPRAAAPARARTGRARTGRRKRRRPRNLQGHAPPGGQSIQVEPALHRRVGKPLQGSMLLCRTPPLVRQASFWRRPSRVRSSCSSIWSRPPTSATLPSPSKIDSSTPRSG